MKVLVCFFALLISGCASKVFDTDSKRKATPALLAKHVNTVLNKCPNSFWEQLNWSDSYLIIKDSNNGKLWRLSFDSDDFSQDLVLISDVKALPQAFHYFQGFTHVDNSDQFAFGIEIKRKSLLTDILHTTFHEGFHFIEQKKWSKSKPQKETNFSRGSIYPTKLEPTLYNSLVVFHLKRAYSKNSQEELGFAKYWHQKLVNEYPDYYQHYKQTGISESTAEFATQSAMTVAIYGCAATPDNFKNTYLKNINAFLGADYTASESYYAEGVILGALLKERGQPFYQQASNDVYMRDILLESVTPIETTPNKQVLEAISQNIESSNLKAKKVLEPFINGFKSSQTLRLSIDVNQMAGAFKVGGFYVYPEQNIDLINILKMQITINNESVKLQNINVSPNVNKTKICGYEHSMTFLLDKSAINNGYVTLPSADNSKFKLSDLRVETEANNTWICLNN